MAKNTELAPLESFKIATRYEGMDEDMIAELKEQMADLDDAGISCNVIKIPSGGGIAFEIQMGGDPSDTDSQKEITGVVCFTHRMNAYWPTTYGSGEDGSQIPTCSSMDGKTGLNTETGEISNCDTCPLNQYGTDIKGGKGKACKNMRRIYIMCDNDPTPYLLTVPPTSIKDVNKQLTRILAAGIPYTNMIMRFKLEKTKNANGVAYSKVIIEKAGPLPAGAAAAITGLRREIKEQYSSMAITMDDYVTVSDPAPAPAQAPAQSAPETQAPEPADVQDGDFEDAAPLPFK